MGANDPRVRAIFDPRNLIRRRYIQDTRYKKLYLTAVMSITINISYFTDKHDSRITYNIEAVKQKILEDF